MNVYMDDIRTPGDWEFVDHANWVVVRRVEYVQELLQAGLVDNMSLDHDMGPGLDGTDLIKWMVETGHWPRKDIYLHSANPDGRKRMASFLRLRPK